MDVIRIPKEKTESVWILVKEYIRNALIYSGSHHHTDHYKDLIKDGKLQLWIIWDEKKPNVDEQFNGLVLSQIIQRSIKKVLHLPMVTGKNRQQWQDLIVKIENFAIDFFYESSCSLKLSFKYVTINENSFRHYKNDYCIYISL